MTLAILLALHAGRRHIGAQLNSLADQTFRDWSLTVVDDGPDDGGRGLVARFSDYSPQSVSYHRQTTRGFAENFLSGLSKLPQDASGLAFCDQDDIWLPEKLGRATEALAKVPEAVPALYCSTRIVWAPEIDLQVTSPPPQHEPSFRNALVENIATGNTIVLNRAALRLAKDVAPLAMDVFAHDWWLYQLITGVGGRVMFDQRPSLLYRQHRGAVLGEGRGMRAALRNKRNAVRGLYRSRIDHQLDALTRIQTLLTGKNRACLQRFQTARHDTRPIQRMLALARSGVHRQSTASQVSFLGGGLIGCV
ncbi:glycosyltransferase [Celeribacter litoreus]|uniref:glycosyltransferase n=1 Tax=Celeribacter litoreus TaxID=2876714 RepID=UPI001CCAFD53|nr:glycosyltransferase [Celeribacter litoreus]MCA0042070.1 glycosyltransferase [Celeribacter litoreus]